MMKITRLKKQTKLVTPFARMIKKSQLVIVLTLKAMTINCCTCFSIHALAKDRVSCCEVRTKNVSSPRIERKTNTAAAIPAAAIVRLRCNLRAEHIRSTSTNIPWEPTISRNGIRGSICLGACRSKSDMAAKYTTGKERNNISCLLLRKASRKISNITSRPKGKPKLFLRVLP